MACYTDDKCPNCGTIAYNLEPGKTYTCYSCSTMFTVSGVPTAYCASLGGGFHGNEFNLGWEYHDLSANVGRRNGGLQPSTRDDSMSGWGEVLYLLAKGVSDAVKTADRRHRHNQLWHTNAFHNW